MNNRIGLQWNLYGSNAGAIEVRAIEVGVLGLINGRGLRWNVCGSNVGAIEVGAIELGVLGLNNGRGCGGMCGGMYVFLLRSVYLKSCFEVGGRRRGGGGGGGGVTDLT